MHNSLFKKIRDLVIIFFILIIFIAVIFIFFDEIKKNQKIKVSKENFYFVKEEILISLKECNDKVNEWAFGGSCKLLPKKENLEKYFNEERKIINPHDKSYGVNFNPGSVLIKISQDKILISVDIDASGGIDIQHTFDLKQS